MGKTSLTTLNNLFKETYGPVIKSMRRYPGDVADAIKLRDKKRHARRVRILKEAMGVPVEKA